MPARSARESRKRRSARSRAGGCREGRAPSGRPRTVTEAGRLPAGACRLVWTIVGIPTGTVCAGGVTSRPAPRIRTWPFPRSVCAAAATEGERERDCANNSQLQRRCAWPRAGAQSTARRSGSDHGSPACEGIPIDRPRSLTESVQKPLACRVRSWPGKGRKRRPSSPCPAPFPSPCPAGLPLGSRRSTLRLGLHVLHVGLSLHVGGRRLVDGVEPCLSSGLLGSPVRRRWRRRRWCMCLPFRLHFRRRGTVVDGCCRPLVLHALLVRRRGAGADGPSPFRAFRAQEAWALMYRCLLLPPCFAGGGGSERTARSDVTASVFERDACCGACLSWAAICFSLSLAGTTTGARPPWSDVRIGTGCVFAEAMLTR